MSSGLFLLFFVFPSCSFAGGKDAAFKPKIEVEYKVVLSTGMEAALTIYDPEFKIWEARDFEPFLRDIYTYGPSPGRYFHTYQVLSAVIGDFNGDKISDIVLIGHNKTHEKRIVLISSTTDYSVVELLNHPLHDPLFSPTAHKGGGNIGQCLEFVSPGKIKAEPAYNRPELNLVNDAFKFGGETGSILYYYENGKFVDYAMSD